jgi:hypothetical protein
MLQAIYGPPIRSLETRGYAVKSNDSNEIC